MVEKKQLTLRYVPKILTKKDRYKQIKMIDKSKKLYKKGVYFTRKPLPSFSSKISPHIIKAKKIYNVEKIGATDELVRKTGCSKKALQKIIQKGEGAYFSSGSRPNQTAQSWGNARLASSLTAGKAGAVDYNILMEGCRPGSKGYRMAKKSRQKYGFGKRKTKKIKINY